MPVQTSKKSKSKSKSSADNMDAALEALLFDVPSNPNSSIKIPRRLPRNASSRPTQSLASSSTPSTQSHKSMLDGGDVDGAATNEDGHRTKRLRASEPATTMIEDSNPFSDDGYYATEPSTGPEGAIDQKMSQMADDPDTLEPEPDNSGIEVAPLDADTKKNLLFVDGPDGKQHTHFYWYDCCEGPGQGTVYFFGRIQVPGNKFVSCCVIVKNVTRRFYLSIAPDCTYDEAVGEFTHITAKRYRMKNFTCQKVTKRFAFGAGPSSNAPLESEYVMVECSANQPVLPADLKGETFSAIYNVNQSPMEKLILDLKLRGPAWLRLVEPMASTPQITWTRIELVLESPVNLQVEENLATTANLSKPYFCVMSLALLTYAHPNIPGRNDIIAISVMTNTCFRLDQCLNRKSKGCGHFMIMTKPPASQKEHLRLPWDFATALRRFRTTRLELVESERDLLTSFMERFNQLDPDIVVGHDLLNYDFETLVRQMAINKVGAWDKLGRFKRNTLPSSKKAFPYIFSGRVLCDIKKSAEELMQLRAYDLTELSLQILDRERTEYNHAKIIDSYKSSDTLLEMLRESWRDVDSIFSILVEMNIIPLALKITNITGNILSRTLAAGRSERNEYLLLHAFHEENFICPEKVLAWEKKNQKKATTSGGGDEQDNEPAEPVQGRRKAAYTGGLVLEPKAGFYETAILLMDFNSLYPSIIQEFNICFSTVRVPEGRNGAEAEEAAADVPSDSVATGVLPAQLKRLVRQRREVKARMKVCKEPATLALLDIEQRALKLTANSMYGCLGFEYSRFYAKHLASLVTSKGREILMSTKAMVENLGYEVIYGDTDSLMIDTKLTEYADVMMRGRNIKEEINRRFKLLEIDVDGVYQPLLLLKKKNYAGASLSLAGPASAGPANATQPPEIVRKIETKGLDSVRRDRAVIAKEAGEHILGMIMDPGRGDICQTVQEIHVYLRELAARVSAHELPPEKYLISKQLNKNPEEYRDTKGIGHVTIALRLNAEPSRTRKLRAGDVINYAICTDQTGESANQRGYTLEEMRAQPDKLKIDHEYYLCQQIYPAVSRICDKLPFTSAYAIAEAMGIENASGIKIPRDPSNAAALKDQLVSKGEQRFVSCEPLAIECPSCTYIEQIRSKTRSKANKQIYALVECSNCQARYASHTRKVVAQVIAHIKQLTLRVYNPRFNCPDCDHTTRNIFGPLGDQGRPVCIKCTAPLEPEMDDRLMDLQLSYFKYLLDLQNDAGDAPKATSNAQADQLSDDVRDLYKLCFDEVLAALKMSFINTIDAQTVFSMVCSSR